MNKQGLNTILDLIVVGGKNEIPLLSKLGSLFKRGKCIGIDCYKNPLMLVKKADGLYQLKQYCKKIRLRQKPEVIHNINPNLNMPTCKKGESLSWVAVETMTSGTGTQQERYITSFVETPKGTEITRSIPVHGVDVQGHLTTHVDNYILSSGNPFHYGSWRQI